MQITSAMKMVSAAKLKKAQDAITAMRPYASKLTELIQNLSGGLGADGENPYTASRPEENVLLISINFKFLLLEIFFNIGYSFISLSVIT